MNLTSSLVLKRIAQWGLISKGIVYMIFGLLILMAVFGQHSKPVKLFGILKYIIDMGWLGRALVLALIIGLFCYSVWKFCQMVFNTEQCRNDLNGYFIRITWLGPFLFYLILGAHAALQLYRFYFGTRGGWDGMGMQELLQYAPGKYVIAFLSLSLFANGVSLFYLAFSGKYRLMLTGKGFYRDSPRYARITGFSGYFFYGLALIIISALFAAALYTSDIAMAQSSISMFDFLKSKPFGVFLLIAIALGTVCYGIYFFSASFYRWREPEGSVSASSTSTGK